MSVPSFGGAGPLPPDSSPASWRNGAPEAIGEWPPRGPSSVIASPDPTVT